VETALGCKKEPLEGFDVAVIAGWVKLRTIERTNVIS
jgi:hypothetical protein